MRFIFNPEREAVTEESGDSVNRLIRASELIAATSDADSARTYYHYASDEMGSITHIVDEAGGVQNRYEYDAWGNITAQEENVPNRFKFTGQQFDPVAQQYYLRARFYNPVVARFTQEDTYRGDGLNLYAYCANNPVRYWDPSGHVCEGKDPQGGPKQPESTALAVYDPHFASEQRALAGEIYQDAKGNWHDPDNNNQFVAKPTSQMKPEAPKADVPVAGDVHKNSKDSMSPNHGYEIYNVNTGDVVKTGISGQPLNQNGSSPRANTQVNALNRRDDGNIYAARIMVQDLPGRRAALEWEQQNTNRLFREGNSMSEHKLPRPQKEEN